MADPTQATAVDKTSPDYWKQFGPENRREEKQTSILPHMPQGSIDFEREALLGATELGIGTVGLPATLARGAWGAVHMLDPTGTIPEVPAIMYPSGPEGYGTRLENALGVTPSNAGERIFAGGLRSAGSGALFGPRSALISGTTGALGQGMTEAGLPPWMGQSVDFLGGLYGGYSGASRGGGVAGLMPGRPSAAPTPGATPAPVPAPIAPRLDPSQIMGGESNVIPFPRGGAQPAPRPVPTPSGAAPAAQPAPAAGGGHTFDPQVQQIIDLERAAQRRAIAEPIVRNPLNPLNYVRAAALRALSYGTSGQARAAATSTAQRLLGLGGGVGLGVTSAQEQEQIPPPP